MKTMNFTPENFRKYFAHRLDGQRLPNLSGSVKCPFHDDKISSLSINLEKGFWKCHAGCGEGVVVDFEMKFSGCNRDTALANIADIWGESQFHLHREKPEAVYEYKDALGRIVFEKLRYPGKRFVQRKSDGKGGYDYKLGDVKKPLYNLPDLLVATQVFVTEGEKDADNLRAALPKDQHVAVVTNFDGAGKWRDEYSVFFAGKRVVILPDNDEPGRKHGDDVARSVSRYALGVKLLNLSGLPEKGDVSDYLENHSIDDLFKELKTCPMWHPTPSASSSLLVSAPEFVAQVPEVVDWMVEGVIERGSNGFIVANPKTGKSWSATDLAISLALGCDWLGFKIPRPVKVALISREDNPALTGWRMRHLTAGKGSSPELLQTNLYLNTRRQSPELMLDNTQQMAEMTDALKTLGTEFVIFDVFNILHAADENDAQEMRRVMKRLTQLQQEVGCNIGVIHHFSKGTDGMSLTQRLRGSSAISGWCEWLIGLSMADAETKIRKMEFEIKAAESPEPIYFTIESQDGWSRLHRCDYTPSTSPRGSAARYMQQ
jgi:hypothetical protein